MTTDRQLSPTPPEVSPAEASPAAGLGAKLVGTFRTPPVSMAWMERVALAEGYARADVEEYLTGSFGHAEKEQYILEVSATHWVVFIRVDGDEPVDIWAGPYQIVDDSTVVAGTPPCGSITVEIPRT